MRETAKTSVGRKLRMGDLTVNVPNSAITKSARPVSSNYVYIFLMEVLLCGGLTVVGVKERGLKGLRGKAQGWRYHESQRYTRHSNYSIPP